MAFRWRVIVSTLAVLLEGAGCASVISHTAHKSPLAHATAPPDSVSLEVFLAGFSGDKQLDQAIWNEIDEQKFPAQLRRELAQNGFRAGVVGSHVPMELARLMKLTDEHPASDAPTEITCEEPTVTLHVFQTRAGHRVLIPPLHHVYDDLPLLMRENGQLRGETFHKAEGRITLRAYPEKDGTVRLELVPEVAYGEERQRWTGTEGMMLFEMSKPRKVLDQLALQIKLAPGEMLILTSAADHPGSIGHYFFNQPTASQCTQKLLLIRIAKTAVDPSFGDETTKTLDLLIE